MKIANFREYIAVLREIYTQEAMGEMGNYYHALMTSGSDLKKKKAALQKNIYQLSAEIKAQAEKIRAAEDKKAAGLEMKELQRQKQQQVKLLKELQDSNHFNVLSDEAKANICSGFLLQKYLARELIENNPLRFKTDGRGDLVVDAKALRQSDIFHEAIHLRDFVAAYVAHYPEKVKTPGHFKTMLNGVKDWRALLEYANAYFERMNDNAFMEDGAIKASRQGCEVIKVWPEKGLQLVRLHTLKALDYESDKMKHCVGKGAYDKNVLSGKTHIYSLRDMSEEGEWLPHATIEYTENKIQQICGYDNKSVPHEYRKLVKEAIEVICGTDDLMELKKSGRFYGWSSLGYLEDETGKLHDTSDMREEAVFSCLGTDDLPQSDDFLPLMIVKVLKFSNVVDEGMLARLKKLKTVGELDANGYFATDYRQLRNTVAELFGTLDPRELSGRINGGVWKAMGYAKELLTIEEYQARRNCDDVLTWYDTIEDDVWLDMIRLDRIVNIGKVEPDSLLWKDADWAHLICRKMEVKNKANNEELRHISELAGCYVVHFDKMDFSQNETVDLSGLRMYEILPETRALSLPLPLDGWFLEGSNIMHWVGGRAVIFDDCRNLPAGDKIMFPPEVRHIVLGAEPCSKDYHQQSLPDFSQYKQLESLQLSHYDLAENAIIRLPENIRYLSFYKCKFGKGQVWDLSHFKQLETLRVCGSDLSEIENYVFPESLKTFAVGGGQFKKGISWDFSCCPRMKAVDFFCFGRVDPIAVEHISFPKAVEEIKLTSGNFPEMRKLDFSVYPHLKKLDLSFASFPSLQRMLLPENCVLEQKELKVPENAVIERRESKEISVRPANEQIMHKLLLRGNRTADVH